MQNSSGLLAALEGMPADELVVLLCEGAEQMTMPPETPKLKMWFTLPGDMLKGTLRTESMMPNVSPDVLTHILLKDIRFKLVSPTRGEVLDAMQEASGPDLLLKSEDEGAHTNERQMKDALEIGETEKALISAGYKRQLDGTFENNWFTARVDGDLEEGIVPPQRKVIYEKKKL